MKLFVLLVSVLLYAGCVQDTLETSIGEVPENPEDTTTPPVVDTPAVSRDTVHLSVAGAPTLLTPAQGFQDVPYVVALTWSWNEGSPPWRYRIQMSLDSLFTSPVMNMITTGTPLLNRGGLVASTKYYWRVRVEKNDSIGPWSARGWFVTMTPPVVVTPDWSYIRYPADGAVDVPLQTRLQWSRADRATSYRVQFGTDSTFSSLQKDTTLADTSVAVGTLAHLDSYHWRVRSENAHGETGWASARFRAFEGYQIFNRGKIGDEWIYFDDVSKRILKYSLQGISHAGDRTTFRFMTSQSVCGSDFTAFELSDSTCFGPQTAREATIKWGEDSAVASVGLFPLYFSNFSSEYIQNLDVLRSPVRIIWGGSPHALLRQSFNSTYTSIKAHYLENVGMVKLQYSQIKPFPYAEAYMLISYNGKAISSENLVTFNP